MGIIKVVCGIIYYDEKVFICRRKPGKSLSGYWEFPGGKVESNETHHLALKRELHEELEMEVNIESFIGQSNHDYGKFQIELFGYACNLVNYSGKLSDHDTYEWVDIALLSDYMLAPADIPFVQIIKNLTTKPKLH